MASKHVAWERATRAARRSVDTCMSLAAVTGVGDDGDSITEV